MLVKEGYAVFAIVLFGAGVRSTKVEDKRQHTDELYMHVYGCMTLTQTSPAYAGLMV